MAGGSYFKGWASTLPYINNQGAGKSVQEVFIGHVLEVDYENDLGKIRVRLTGATRQADDDLITTEAYPADLNIIKYPIPGELVLVVQAIRNDFKSNKPATAYYYLTTISSDQSVIYNSDPYIGHTVPEVISDRIFTPQYETRFEKRFTDKDKFIKQNGNLKERGALKPTEGDFVIQGRFGATIRMGSTGNDNPWSGKKSGAPGSPILVVAANKKETTSDIVENVNGDASSIYFCSTQQLKVNMATSIRLSTHRHKYDIKQDIIVSDDTSQFLNTNFIAYSLDGGGSGAEADTNPFDSLGSRVPWDPSTYRPGTLASLPTTYSHTETQGYNLLNSKWIGDLITSAKSHIRTPTYDVPGTEKGNLGCASAVSIIFYRAFGVDMLTGKPVKAIPRDIGDFGSKGTSTLGGGFAKNPTLWERYPWKEAQPGDIMNTQRLSDKVAGHIGIVIDTKSRDGSFDIISNSSAGFAGGGGGAVKQNYTVKAWQSVTNRNPSQTFAWRYVGPVLTAAT